jgi:molybdate-binding protein/DNA-binding XRE family transcriptional regulator
VKAIESGRYTPNTAVALRLASALASRVEDIFRLEVDGPEVSGRMAGESAQPGDRLAVARVGDELVAYPLRGAHSIVETLVPAGGIAGDDGDTIRLFSPPETADQTAFVLGCDPSLSILSDRISGGTAGARLVCLYASSQSALDALTAGTAHIAGSHFPGDGDESLREARRVLSPGGGIVVTYASWQQGFIVPRGNPAAIRRIEDLADRDLRFINREQGSGSRKLADQLVAEAGLPETAIAGYSTQAPSHAAVARAVASGQADAGIGLEVIAEAFGLGFVPLAEVRFDLVIPDQHAAHPVVQAMLDVLQSRSLRADLGALPGYDVARTGTTVLEQRAA